ncbi:MFS transporter [Crenothrix sp.]|uniref:MFS transporter n=1 Tax=Crenothrix sp. TaxID=3100433 RepID=UPI00374CB157
MPIPYFRLSGYYFFYFATLGAFLPYWNLYLKHCGFNAMQIGEFSALIVGTRIISPNLVGYIADRTGKNLPIIRMTSLYTVLIFAYFLFPQNYVELALITAGFGLFWNASLPQFEAVTLFHLKNQTQRYSQIRLWGSVGFVIAVLGIGRLLDNQPITRLPIIIAILLVGSWITTLITPEAKPIKHKIAAIGLMNILKKPEVLAFFAVNVLLQISHGPYYVFYSIYLADYHYSSTLTGFLWALGVCAEIVLFIAMQRLLKYFSLRTLLLLSLLLSAIRWLMIAWCANSLIGLVIAQLLHAASFGSTHVIAISLVHKYFGEQHQGKGQALYSSLSFGLGGMIGSLYSGHYWNVLGPQFVYSIAALCCVIAFVVTYLWLERENNRALS